MSTEQQFYTPGPWDVIEAGFGMSIYAGAWASGTRTKIAKLTELARPGDGPLIASAPNLFVELTQASAMLHHIMGGGSYSAKDYMDYLHRIDTVLAKAVQS